ncbi:MULTISPECIES: universal stress protein [unclassified Comamonas]|uniref:universal stress protein n=1 Tax=unclassified Comamonas TaxID=2638500 RepID=UPI000EB3D3BE|nr:universal stress protein [Comamonas sp. lk]
MFKHLLIPTDGSKLSEAAVRSGICFAREQNARVTGLYVMPDYRTVIYGADALLSANHTDFTDSVNTDADNALQYMERIARQEGVGSKFVRVTSVSIYQAIIDQAEESACDLIYMASHGRRGIAAILLGSETQRVLTHTHIPVLVHRSASVSS